jgi:hypothetical protein
MNGKCLRVALGRLLEYLHTTPMREEASPEMSFSCVEIILSPSSTSANKSGIPTSGMLFQGITTPSSRMLTWKRWGIMTAEELEK